MVMINNHTFFIVQRREHSRFYLISQLKFQYESHYQFQLSLRLCHVFGQTISVSPFISDFQFLTTRFKISLTKATDTDSGNEHQTHKKQLKVVITQMHCWLRVELIMLFFHIVSRYSLWKEQDIIGYKSRNCLKKLVSLGNYPV